MDRPQYVNWIVREAGVVFEDQQPLNCYRLSYVIDDAILDDWALHIRRHYVPDDELEEDAALNKLTVEEYLRQYVIRKKENHLDRRHGQMILAKFYLQIYLSSS
ncbi:MAG: hypothetical protein V8R55_10730 [Dysosmobacter sp.]